MRYKLSDHLLEYKSIIIQAPAAIGDKVYVVFIDTIPEDATVFDVLQDRATISGAHIEEGLAESVTITQSAAGYSCRYTVNGREAYKVFRDKGLAEKEVAAVKDDSDEIIGEDQIDVEVQWIQLGLGDEIEGKVLGKAATLKVSSITRNADGAFEVGFQDFTN